MDRGLRDQIQRAAISIMSNIAEGFESKGANELAMKVSRMLSSFISYLKSAKKLEGWGR